MYREVQIGMYARLFSNKRIDSPPAIYPEGQIRSFKGTTKRNNFLE